MNNDQLIDLRDAIDAKLNRKPWQFRHRSVEGWTDARDGCVIDTQSDLLYRPKPEPKVRPWSFETRPMDAVWVYRRHFITDSQIVAWGDDCVVIATKHGLLNQGYDQLFDDWLQRDGSPCGRSE